MSQCHVLVQDVTKVRIIVKISNTRLLSAADISYHIPPYHCLCIDASALRSHTLPSNRQALEGYNFGDAGRQIYEFLWDEYADWYIEVSKTRMRVRALGCGVFISIQMESSVIELSCVEFIVSHLTDLNCFKIPLFLLFLSSSLGGRGYRESQGIFPAISCSAL